MKGSKEARTMTKRVGSRKVYEPLIMFVLSISSYNIFDQNWNRIDDSQKIYTKTYTYFLSEDEYGNQSNDCMPLVGGGTDKVMSDPPPLPMPMAMPMHMPRPMPMPMPMVVTTRHTGFSIGIVICSTS